MAAAEELQRFPSARHYAVRNASGAADSVRQHREPLAPVQLQFAAAHPTATAPPLPTYTAKPGLTSGDVDDHATRLYISGELPSPKAFAFQRGRLRIDWRALAGVDADQVVRVPRI